MRCAAVLGAMRVGRNVALLAAASFLADVSGEMLMAVFPFLLLAQGATGLGLGLAGGAADAVGHLVKPFAGAIADRTRRRKPLVLGGYLTAALARIGIALSTFWLTSILFRAADRVGKGLRSSPRDALLAESVPAAQRGRAFGLHRAADTAGAVVGVLLVLALLARDAEPGTIVLAGALVGLLTALPLLLVREVEHEASAGTRVFEPASPRYKAFLAIAALGALGQVSYLFFLVRVAGAVGASGAVALYLFFNVVYFAAAYPAGVFADRVGRPRVLSLGFGLFAASCGLMVLPASLPLAIVAFGVLGLAFACIDGVERALASDLAGSVARSTRLGVFHATVGLATVAGGVTAGLLWDRVSPASTFAFGGATLLLAAFAMLRAQAGFKARS